ncbi:hypothetical protein GO816_02460 [Mucilaginibacter sp. HME9299]|uniref:Uncharacterized protein n=2 Tax=Mucilaginibacter aquatilis TaxID=1517760 RepID=A0A6I4I798_9SPHI|nr:hypothetical protein [Mucilaginibacter aquatilis]
MKEANFIEMQSPKPLPVILNAWLYSKKSTSTNIPSVNTYLCQTAEGDTVIILDASLKNLNINFSSTKPWAEVKPKKRYESCETAVPKDELSRIMKMKYKYAELTVVIEN